jgi:hypothetical protein
MSDIFCPMIHGGLHVNLKTNDRLGYNQCCLSTTPLTFVDKNLVNWTDKDFIENRQTNNANQWLPGCWQCESLEKTHVKSFRQSMIEKFGVVKNLSGPQRIDLIFDRSCNLACRTCGPQSSTFWQKHLVDNSIGFQKNVNNKDNSEKIHSILKSMDLSNLRMLQFCGGETLLGNNYWNVAEIVSTLVPNAKTVLEIGFQTNGTQPIDKKHYDTIEKFQLVKILISIDGIGDRFEYLRWPANWNQVTDNILTLKETLPSNVMFFVQECTSCLNLYYYNEVSTWVKENFNTNREGDPTNHTTQLAARTYLTVNAITQEYVNALKGTDMIHMLSPTWQENPNIIKTFLRETEKFDLIRGQDWKKTFPEVAEFYSRYL